MVGLEDAERTERKDWTESVAWLGEVVLSLVQKGQARTFEHSRVPLKSLAEMKEGRVRGDEGRAQRGVA